MLGHGTQYGCFCLPYIVLPSRVSRLQQPGHPQSCAAFGSCSSILRCPFSLQKLHRKRCRPVSAADMSADIPEEPEDEAPILSEVFSRIREKDPYRRLGVSREASFEEVQDARNFLYEAYKRHESSRESIELAFDRILQEDFKKREKFGFQPPKMGRKTDVQGDALRPSLVQRLKDSVEPAGSIPLATIVNDGTIFIVLAVWAAWQTAATDPTFPMALAISFAVYRFFSKEKNRNPEGPFWGNSPIWAALVKTFVGFLVSYLVSTLLLRFVPLPPSLPSDGVGLFLVCTLLGLISLFFR